MVELNTPGGSLFSGQAGDVELRTTDGVTAINPREESYLHLTQSTQFTLPAGTEFFGFVRKHAAAGLRGGRLTVMAGEMRPL